MTYIHLMFDRHEIVLSEGAWTESFQPGPASVGGLEEDARAELLDLFPELRRDGAYHPPARRTLKGYEARVLMSA